MKVTEISSPTNAVYKQFLSLLESKGLKKENLFLLSGKDLVQEFLKKPNLKISSEIIAPGRNALSSAKSFALAKPLFEEIDVLGTKENILVLEQPEYANWSGTGTGLTVFLPLGDPGNLGALLRSCEAFGVSQVVLLAEAAHPFLPKAVKASAGSVLRLKLFKGPSIHKLESKNLMVLDMQGTALKKISWPKNPQLLVGEEGPGIPSSLAQSAQKIKIEIFGVESLNATVAASIALYDFATRS
jgi:RNA methyltransferase, TrmH family